MLLFLYKYFYTLYFSSGALLSHNVILGLPKRHNVTHQCQEVTRTLKDENIKLHNYGYLTMTYGTQHKTATVENYQTQGGFFLMRKYITKCLNNNKRIQILCQGLKLLWSVTFGCLRSAVYVRVFTFVTCVAFCCVRAQNNGIVFSKRRIAFS